VQFRYGTPAVGFKLFCQLAVPDVCFCPPAVSEFCFSSRKTGSTIFWTDWFSLMSLSNKTLLLLQLCIFPWNSHCRFYVKNLTLQKHHCFWFSTPAKEMDPEMHRSYVWLCSLFQWRLSFKAKFPPRVHWRCALRAGAKVQAPGPPPSKKRSSFGLQ